MDHGKQINVLLICVLREASERAIGKVYAALRLPKPDRPACRSLGEDWRAGEMEVGLHG